MSDDRRTMDRLREETRGLHEAAEKTDFQQAVLSGRLPRERYVESLAQMLVVHRALEAHLRRLREARAEMRGLLQDYQFQEPYLRADLRFFGYDVESIVPNAATRETAAAIDELGGREPVAVLGCHYVLEGSKNGGRFLAEKVRKAYGLGGADGTRYLDPYGDQQRAYWQAFRDDMNRIAFSRAEMAAILKAASAAFVGITQVYERLFREHARTIET